MIIFHIPTRQNWCILINSSEMHCCPLRRNLYTCMWLLWLLLVFYLPLQLQYQGTNTTCEKNKEAGYFFSILNYWFACLSSVDIPPFAKLFTLGNIISGISLNVQGFQTRSNCLEWKSLMKHGHSTKSNSLKKLESIIRVLKSIKLWIRLSNKVELTQGKLE